MLSANGPAFCAGMDLDEMQGRADAPNADDEWDKDASDYRDLLVAILKLDVPTLAVVQGPAIAGGFGLVLACDLVLASSAARFALPEPKRGISPAVVSPLLIYRIGVGPATPLLLAGQVLTAEAAFRVGLCHIGIAAGEAGSVAGRIGDADSGRCAAGTGDDQAAGAKFRTRDAARATRGGKESFGRSAPHAQSARGTGGLPRKTRTELVCPARTEIGLRSVDAAPAQLCSVGLQSGLSRVRAASASDNWTPASSRSATHSAI